MVLFLHNLTKVAVLCRIRIAESGTRPPCLEIRFRSAAISQRRRIRRSRCGSAAGHGIAVLVDLHAKAETHVGEDLLDLVQRLAAEVLGLQHLCFGFLHQLADGLNVSVLQAVVAAYREFQLFDRAVQVLVADFRLASIASGLRFSSSSKLMKMNMWSFSSLAASPSASAGV